MDLFFNRIVGIDQTGALDRKNRFRPLYAFRIELGSRGEISTYGAEYLPTLDLNAWRTPETRTLVVIDAVLGLPERLWKPGESIRDLFQLTRALKLFGRKGSECFYSDLYLSRTGHELAGTRSDDELRECERALGAQSLFRAKPFQRNVQTGTLRIWHELSQQNLDQVAIWPFDRIDERVKMVIAEGYPRVFRNISLPKLSELENPNFRDAARLAWGAHAKMLHSKNFLRETPCREGAILTNDEMATP